MGGGGTPQPIYHGQEPIKVSPFAHLYERPLPDSMKGAGTSTGQVRTMPWRDVQVTDAMVRPAVMPDRRPLPDSMKGEGTSTERRGGQVTDAMVRPAVMPGGQLWGGATFSKAVMPQRMER